MTHFGRIGRISYNFVRCSWLRTYGS